jgi:hypothetical protein
MLDADERRYLIVDANVYGATNDDNSGNIGTEDVKNNKESTTNCNRKVWFRGLVALVTSRFWRLTGW